MKMTPMYRLIDGKKLADTIIEAVKYEITSEGLEPQLAVVLVGTDPASHLYVKLKEQASKRAGIEFSKYLVDEDASEEKLIELIQSLNADPLIDAILIQLPLPKKFNQEKIIDTLDYRKDVDGFHKKNIERLLAGKKQHILPGLALGILNLIESTGEKNYTGKETLIISKSREFSVPLQAILKKNGMCVHIIGPDELHLLDHTKDADIIITAVGRPNFITQDMIKKGSTIIDVGISTVGGKVVGDVDVKNVAPHTSYITPVPGGVGPMTVAMLLYNTLQLAKLRHNDTIKV